MVHLVQTRQRSPWIWSDLLFGLSSWKAVQDKCLGVLHGFSRQVIRERRREFEEEKDELAERKRLVRFKYVLPCGKTSTALVCRRPSST